MTDGVTPKSGPAGDRFAQVLGARPELLRDFERFYALFWERRLVPLGVLELVRLNVARLLDCGSELRRRHVDEGEPLIDEEDVAKLSLTDYVGLEEGVRACLRFSEKFVFDVHGIDDADVAAVREHLGVEGTVALTEALALFDGFMRFRNLLAPEDAPAFGAEPIHVPLPSLDSVPSAAPSGGSGATA
jgi:alkylhydroperoxidase family enzyme